MTDTTPLVTQLRALLSLTHTEEQIARIRVAQARTDAVRLSWSRTPSTPPSAAPPSPTSCASSVG